MIALFVVCNICVQFKARGMMVLSSVLYVI